MFLSFHAEDGVNAYGGTTKIATILEVVIDPKKREEIIVSCTLSF